MTENLDEISCHVRKAPANTGANLEFSYIIFQLMKNAYYIHYIFTYTYNDEIDMDYPLICHIFLKDSLTDV